MEQKHNPALAKAMETPDFYEEMLLLRAQELVSQLMEEKKITKAALAKKLDTSKAHITGLLSDGRNMTLKTLGRVCYHLGAEVVVNYRPLNHETHVVSEERKESEYKTKNEIAADTVSAAPITPMYLN